MKLKLIIDVCSSAESRVILRTAVVAVVLIVLAAGTVLARQTEPGENPRSAPSDIMFTLFFVGNTGIGDELTLQTSLDLLKKQLSLQEENAAVVFLGDQLPEGGLPRSGDPGRKSAESRLDMLVSTVESFRGKVFVIPGENEYGASATPLDALLRQEEYLEQKMNRGNVFIPDGGFPGPHEVKLNDDIRMVAINTQWLLNENPSPVGDTGEYIARESVDFYSELDEIILDRYTDDLVVLGHHPIMSNGTYAGHSGRLYMLPVIGTAAHAIKRMSRDEQYFGGVRNEWMRERLFDTLSRHENVIYTSAHDLSLQRFESERENFSQSFLVSGSASASSRVEKEHELTGYDTEFVSEEIGFMTTHFYRNGSIWIDAWAADEKLPDGTLLYSGMVRKAELNTAAPSFETIRPPGFADSTRVVIPNSSFEVGSLRKWFLGANWRDIWATPVEVNNLDLETAGGGLNAVKRGGGMQTLSVRMENEDGQQFVARSVNKDGARVLPPVWQPTFVGSFLNDLMSYSNPFGVMPIPSLADAAGVYHANPKVVWLPADRRLGDFSSLVGGSLVLFEERPNKDMSHMDSFGNSEDVVGWSEMSYEVTRDNDNRVDAHFMARSRLFDMFMSDWDRHKDQWRWASFKDRDGNGTMYRPIPRDRDNAFNKINAVLYPIVKPFIKIQDYRTSYGNIKGLSTNGRTQDHRHLSGLNESAWVDIADSLTDALTDDIIIESFEKLPDPVFEKVGKELTETAITRREKLPQVASRVYQLHARSVDVMGSNKHERFEVTRIDDDHTLVVVYRTTREGEVRSEMYRRTIVNSETREINLFGLGGNDQFIVTGKVDRGTVVHAVGGAGDDTFNDSSFVSGATQKTRFYDSEHPGNSWTTGNETHVTRSNDPKENAYTGEFEFEQIIPVPFAWFNSEDGLILQLYGLYTQYGFRKTPAAVHTVAVQYATGTTAFSTSYDVVFHEVIKRWNVGVGINYADADNTTNFYGLGNETSNDLKDIFNSGLSRLSARMPFIYSHPLGLSQVFTPALESTKLTDEKFELLEDLDQPGLSAPQSGRQWFASLYSVTNFRYVDQTDNPLHGFNWNIDFDLHAGLSFADDSYVGVGSDLSLYTSLPLRRQITFATRFGAEHIFGTFPFYEANVLGGRTNLRGYASSRFSGRSNAYWNNDLRVELFKIKGGIAPGRLGLLGFADTGRVWTDEESSNKWHVGYGVGLWYNIVDEILFNFTTGKSNEQNYLSAGLGFFF